MRATNASQIVPVASTAIAGLDADVPGDENAVSDQIVFHVATAAPAPGAYVLTFSVSSNRLYDIYQTPVPGTPFEPLALDLPGEPPLNTYTDAAPATSRFYQIRAKPLP